MAGTISRCSVALANYFNYAPLATIDARNVAIPTASAAHATGLARDIGHRLRRLGVELSRCNQWGIVTADGVQIRFGERRSCSWVGYHADLLVLPPLCPWCDELMQIVELNTKIVQIPFRPPQ